MRSDDLVKEKGISKEVLIEAIESALVSAYKKELRNISERESQHRP